jgi:hypothetical protein
MNYENRSNNGNVQQKNQNITTNEGAAERGECTGGMLWTEKLEDAHAFLLSNKKLSALHIYS